MKRRPLTLRNVLWPLTTVAVLLSSWAEFHAAGQEPNQRGARRRLTLRERFRQFDQNGDGVLQRDEIPRLFDRFDANGDGKVTFEEVRQQLGRARSRRPRATAPPPDLSNVRVVRDVGYSQTGQPRSPLRRLDLYAPKEGRDHPVVVYVHGGGWRTGDKAAVHRKVPFFPEHGYVFVSVNYRLVPQVDVLTEAQDVADAVAWVHEHAPEYGGDPNCLFLLGHSAGAHLVALVATNERFLEKAGLKLSAVKGVVPLDTQAYDLVALMSERPSFVYQTAFGDDPKVWKELSPSEHVAPDKGIPAFLICYTRGMGRLVNPRRKAAAQKFAEQLKQAGVQAELLDATDRNHGEVNQRLGRPDDNVTQAVLKFFESVRKDCCPKQ